jgi:hypothetical protein
MHVARIAIVLSVTAFLLAPVGTVAADGGVLVVDDDRMQCRDARFSSIQAAVDKAHAFDEIRVCAGRYAEQVRVNKPLEIEGDAAPLAAVDCLAVTLPALPSSEYVIVESLASPAFSLTADNVDLSGFVVSDPDPGRSITGVYTNDAYSGYRVHGNLFLRNRLAVSFGSGERTESRQASRVDHNCIRDGDWAVADGSLAEPSRLINARIDHNQTFRIEERTYELIHGGEDVLYDHNVSSLDSNGFILSGSVRTRVIENVVDRAVIGMEIGRLEANRDLEIAANTFIGDAGVPAPVAVTAVGFNPPSSGERNSAVSITGNTITGYNTGIAIGGPPNVARGSLRDSEITGNTIIGSRQNAIRLRALNTGLTFSGNTFNNNTRNGVHAECGRIPGTTVEACPTGNVFIGNELIGNGEYDARDDTGIAPDGTLRPLQNTWLDNNCVKDRPTGLLCR